VRNWLDVASSPGLGQLTGLFHRPVPSVQRPTIDPYISTVRDSRHNAQVPIETSRAGAARNAAE
jgi:hypothetical protein